MHCLSTPICWYQVSTLDLANQGKLASKLLGETRLPLRPYSALLLHPLKQRLTRERETAPARPFSNARVGQTSIVARWTFFFQFGTPPIKQLIDVRSPNQSPTSLTTQRGSQMSLRDLQQIAAERRSSEGVAARTGRNSSWWESSCPTRTERAQQS
jgi:hypothetical protein